MIRVFVTAALLALSACGTAPDPLVSEAQEAIKARLRDPAAAQFRNVRRCARPDAVEGEVNGRNAHGGYAGFVGFIYVRGEIAILAAEDIGELLRFDSHQYDQLRRLCWSDDQLRRVEEIVGNLPETANSPRSSTQPTAANRPDDLSDWALGTHELEGDGQLDDDGNPVPASQIARGAQNEQGGEQLQRAMEGQAAPAANRQSGE